MLTKIWDNIGLGNCLFPDGTEPLPEQILTYNQKVMLHSFQDIHLYTQYINLPVVIKICTF